MGKSIKISQSSYYRLVGAASTTDPLLPQFYRVSNCQLCCVPGKLSFEKILLRTIKKLKNITEKMDIFMRVGLDPRSGFFSEFMDPDCPARWLLSDSLIKSAVCIP